MTAERNLILVHQPGSQDVRDFYQIASYVQEIAPDIETFIANNGSRCSVTRKQAARRPTLVFSPGNLIAFKPSRGKVYAGRPISKLDQMVQFQKCGLPVPEFVELRSDTIITPEEWGEFVLVKGSNSIYASRARGMALLRTTSVAYKPQHEFPNNHPGRHGPVFLQRFINTGLHPSHCRVLTLFGHPLWAVRNTSRVPLLSPDISDAELESLIISPSRDAGWSRELLFEQDVIALACRAYHAFPDIPLQACDIIRDASSKTLYLLEINPGGNTWVFSRKSTPQTIQELGGIEPASQFDAFRTAARVLVEKTRAEAQ